MPVKDSKNPDNLNRASSASGSSADGSRQANTRTVRREPVADDAGPLSMTGIRSGAMHSLGMKILLGGLIAIFVGGVALSALTPGGDAASQGGNRPIGGGPDPVARVGDEVVSRDLFQRSFAQQIETSEQYGFGDTGPTGLLDIRSRALTSLAGEAAQVGEAKKRGIVASEEDIEKYISDETDKLLAPQAGETTASVRRRIESEGKTLDSAKEEARKGFDRDLVSRAILLQKLEKTIKDDNKVTEADYRAANTRLSLRQIKISPKPAAPGAKDPKADAAKSEAEAKARAEKIASQLKNATLAQFIAAAKKSSDDVATKAKGGDLGAKLSTELGVSDEVKAALSKATGSLVGPIQDSFSKDFLIFYIANRKLELPKDFAKKKAELLKAFEESQDSTAWNSFASKLAEANKPQIEDPALVAYDIATRQIAASTVVEEQKRLRGEAIAKYEEALEYAGGSEATAIRYQLALQYAANGDMDKQLATLKAATDNSEDRTVKIEYARALANTNQKDEALKMLSQVSQQIDKSPSPAPQFSFGGPQQNPDDQARFQISGLYEQLGKKDLAAKERTKIKPPQAPPGAPGGLNLGGAPGSAGGNTIDLGKVDVGGGKKPITIPVR